MEETMSAITVAPEVESVKNRLKNIWMGGEYDRLSRCMEGSTRDVYERLPVAPGCRLLAVLALALVGLVGCDYEPRAVGDVNPVRVAEMKQAFRDLWVGHLFWVRQVVSINAKNNPDERDAAEKEVEAIARQLAHRLTPFYGEAASQKLFRLLGINYGAIREYSEATLAGNKNLQEAALARLESNADDIADFLSQVNPYLQKDTMRGLIAAHGALQIQITQYKEQEYARLGATWPMLRRRVYVIADTLTMALVKQFPNKFS